MSKVSSPYLEKRLSFAVLSVPKGRFLRYLREFRYFFDFPISSYLDVQKVFYGYFPFLKKIWPKTCIKPPKLKTRNLTLFDLKTLNDLDLTPGPKMLRRVHISIPNTIHVVPSALFQLDTAALPGENSNDSKKSDLCSDLWRDQCRSDKVLQYVRKVIVPSYRIPFSVFGSRIGPVVWQIAGWRGEKRPPPISGKGPGMAQQRAG